MQTHDTVERGRGFMRWEAEARERIGAWVGGGGGDLGGCSPTPQPRFPHTSASSWHMAALGNASTGARQGTLLLQHLMQSRPCMRVLTHVLHCAALCPVSQAVAVVQRAIRGEEPAAMMHDYGFGPVLLIAHFPVKMSGAVPGATVSAHLAALVLHHNAPPRPHARDMPASSAQARADG